MFFCRLIVLLSASLISIASHAGRLNPSISKVFSDIEAIGSPETQAILRQIESSVAAGFFQVKFSYQLNPNEAQYCNKTQYFSAGGFFCPRNPNDHDSISFDLAVINKKNNKFADFQTIVHEYQHYLNLGELLEHGLKNPTNLAYLTDQAKAANEGALIAPHIDAFVTYVLAFIWDESTSIYASYQGLNSLVGVKFKNTSVADVIEHINDGYIANLKQFKITEQQVSSAVLAAIETNSFSEYINSPEMVDLHEELFAMNRSK